MRLTRIAATTLIAGSLALAGTGVALADTVTPVASSSAVSAVSAASEPGDLMLSSTTVKPGAHLTFSGSVATPTSGDGPVTVTSSAFAGSATMTRTDPTAFAGSATIGTDVTAGTYTVTASSSAGTVSSRITVTGTAPTPAHHGSSGTRAGHGSSSGTGSTDADSTAITDPGSDVLPWALGGAGAVALIGGGAYAIGRGRRADRDRAAQARQDYREPRTEVMTRR
ncbi:hypothetical protein [Actinomycetospora sp. NBRC 106378]|uniref:hypothetical protein n=1 Tax=Actinomycetospora sp. NBRC 106378 TaxID=3032208 RepID=UPI0024A0087E|nr:hypothetical protein [Actinomycetospora sp. NBRC 106378]GLZ51598.1 hypothetical protein Acsp07_12150 [Actinomycetospora sp. NBRC 106378]